MYNIIYFYQLLLLYNNHRKIGLYYEIFLIILNLDLMGDQCKLYGTLHKINLKAYMEIS